VKATLAFVLLFMGYMTVTMNDARTERVPQIGAVEVINVPRDPLDPPRCPKANAAGHPLLREVALSADGGPWIHACEYQPTT
jgi:chorismate-pyruvate lyase